LNFSKLHFYSDYQLINIRIGLAFGINIASRFVKDEQQRFWDSSEFNFDKYIEQIELKFNMCPATSSNKIKLTLKSELIQLSSIANYLITIEMFDEALEFYMQALSEYEINDKNKESIYDTWLLYYKVGYSLHMLHQPVHALNYLNQALEIIQNITWNVHNNTRIAVTLTVIGRFITKM